MDIKPGDKVLLNIEASHACDPDKLFPIWQLNVTFGTVKAVSNSKDGIVIDPELSFVKSGSVSGWSSPSTFVKLLRDMADAIEHG